MPTTYTEDFESSFGSWISATAWDWTHNSGGTPSSSTGPSGAYSGSYYVYVEASNGYGNYNAGDIAILEYNASLISNLTFYQHRYGSEIGELRVEGQLEGSSTWQLIKSFTGENSNWVYHDLSTEFGGNVYQAVRFRNIAAGGWHGDVALDLITVTIPDPLNAHIRDGGVWKQAGAIWIKDAGVWKEAGGVYIKDAGVWKQS